MNMQIVEQDSKDTEESGEDKQDLKHELLNCLVAKTALIIPFSFGNHRTPPGMLQQRLLDRQIVGPTGKHHPPVLLLLAKLTCSAGESINIWQLNDAFPMEVAELSRQFHQMIGWRERRAGKNAWRCRRFRMTKEAYDVSHILDATEA